MSEKLQTGIVKKSTGSWYEILDDTGNLVEGKVRGKFRLEGKTSTNPIAVGDHIKFFWDESAGMAIIHELLPRKNYILRKASNLSRQEHIIATNLDLVLIVATLAMPRTSLGFIDRILVTAEAYEIPAMIAFNKADLLDDGQREEVKALTGLYQPIGYNCISISAKNEFGMDKLQDILTGKTTLITGHSGVGKSTLLNKLIPELDLKTSEISEFSSKGKHTTTFAEMHLLNENTYIIDTPGIKEFGIVDIDKEEVSHFFPEMRDLLGMCKFNNCLHINEPGCAVHDALDEGNIATSRYNSYLSILENEDGYR